MVSTASLATRSARPDGSARPVADVLRRRVLDDTWPSGVLPPESALVSELGTTRAAVREALDVLREEGLVEKLPGVGDVAVQPKHVHGLDRLRGLAETFRRKGSVRNEVRVLSLQRAPRAVQSRLCLEDDEDVLYVERVRSLDGVPVSLHLTYLVLDIARHVVGRDLATRDLLALIEEVTGRRLGHADLLLEAVSADGHTAAALGTTRGAPLLMLERLTHLDDGRPVELEFIRFRGDRLSVRATTHRDPDESWSVT